MPWPSYDEFTDAEDIGNLVTQLGLDPAVVAAYEEENQNRESVLEPTGPRTSAVPPAGKPRSRPDGGLEPQPQA